MNPFVQDPENRYAEVAAERFDGSFFNPQAGRPV
ncbi:hypothetical protein B2K_39735 [Paenibacillus mucilaginosus K02]|uniref:Uncharacterized protein n=1 Tax=Paenibacillus mucilaginosus K02 TaxID=997761 RepID=R9UPI2_9BACL|nr:hypothetical protein B2K_39735 [Paenibacillus mucilaginosus K02]